MASHVNRWRLAPLLFVLLVIYCVSVDAKKGIDDSPDYKYTTGLIVVANSDQDTYLFIDTSSNKIINSFKNKAANKNMAGLAYDAHNATIYSFFGGNGVQKLSTSATIGTPLTYSLAENRFDGCVIQSTRALYFTDKNSLSIAYDLIDNALALPSIFVNLLGIGLTPSGIYCNDATNQIAFISTTNRTLRTYDVTTKAFSDLVNLTHSGGALTFSITSQRYYYISVDGGVIGVQLSGFESILLGPFNIPGFVTSILGHIAVAPGTGEAIDDLWITVPNQNLIARLRIAANGTALNEAPLLFNNGRIKSPTGILYIPPVAALPPAYSSVAECQIQLGSDPAFGILAGFSSTDARSQTSSTFGPFITGDKAISQALPSQWSKGQANVGSTFYYAYQGILGDTSSTMITVALVYDPDVELIVDLAEASSQYTLPVAAMKFTVGLEGNASTDLFGNDDTRNLTWSVCFNTNASASTEYTTKNTAYTVTYMFNNNNTNNQLHLRFPTVGIADNKTINVQHTITPSIDPNNNNSLIVCVEWTFPYFTSSLLFDPDIGVLAGGGGDGGGDGDGSDNKWIAAVVVPVVVGVAFIVVVLVLVILVIVVLMRKYVLNPQRHGAPPSPKFHGAINV